MKLQPELAKGIIIQHVARVPPSSAHEKSPTCSSVSAAATGGRKRNPVADATSSWILNTSGPTNNDVRQSREATQLLIKLPPKLSVSPVGEEAGVDRRVRWDTLGCLRGVLLLLSVLLLLIVVSAAIRVCAAIEKGGWHAEEGGGVMKLKTGQQLHRCSSSTVASTRDTDGAAFNAQAM